jgi:hypothetical protein
MEDQTIGCTYYAAPGKDNTERTLQVAKARAAELGIKSVVVATTTGQTGVRASEVFRGYNVVLVSHSTGSKAPNSQELSEENRDAIERNGGRILTCMHAFGGVGRSVRQKFNTYQLNDIVAQVLRIFGEGMKVVSEITLMAADAGLLTVGEPAIAIGGTHRGADTAVVLRPVNVRDFLDMKVMEILCKPGFYDPEM